MEPLLSAPAGASGSDGLTARSHLIEDACYWFKFRNRLYSHAPLKGEYETDVAIVGGGFTGLWTAHFLKKINPETRVAVFEQEVIGYGASGRNGGEPCATIDQTHHSAITHFGLDEAKKMAKVGARNYEEFCQFAADCDFENTGCLHPALSEEHMDTYRELKNAADAVGMEGWLLFDEGEMKKRLHSPLYKGGAFSPEGGIVNPMKVLMKLERLALQTGVRIFENTKVTAVHGGRLKTENGTVRAKRVILATDAYGAKLFPSLLWKYIPLYDYIVVSEPLNDEQLLSIGWKGREAVADARTFFNYYRLTTDNRILWGSSEAKYYFGNDVGAAHDYSENFRTALEASFFKTFPQLSGLTFEYAWGGPIAATTRLSPCFGTLQNGRVLYGLGYTGQGIVCSRFAGQVLAQMALGIQSEMLQLKMVRTGPMVYPPEPIRGWLVKFVRAALRKVDNGEKPNTLLKVLEYFNIGFSS